MLRQGLLWLGIFLILAGISRTLYVHYVFDYSEIERRPIDVAVNTTGGETTVEFTAARQSRYSVSISVAAPQGASNDDAMHIYACMMRQPGCQREHDQCRAPGLLRVSEIKLNNVAQQDASADCHYGISGGGPTRDLFFFDTAPGQHFVVKTKVTVDGAALARLGPRLVVDRAPAWMDEEEDLVGLGADATLLFGCAIGIPCIIVSQRGRRKAKSESAAKK